MCLFFLIIVKYAFEKLIMIIIIRIKILKKIKQLQKSRKNASISELGYFRD